MKRAIVIGLVMAMLFSTEAYGVGLNRGGKQPAAVETAATAEEPEAAQGEEAEEKSKDLEEEEKSKDQTAEEKPENQAADEKSKDLTEARPPVAGVEIPVTEIEPIMIGQVENKEAGTGCTVLVCKDGMKAGLDVRGGGPASRESQLLNPLTSAQYIHAVVLSGGSAYGLGTANGVMSYLEEQGIGYDTGVALVPLVAQSDIFDLSVGDSKSPSGRGHGISGS